MNKLLIISGPTATGKTKLATTLAKVFNGEMVNADSRQVYRHFDILSGKDKPAGSVPGVVLRAIFRNRTYQIPSYLFDGVPMWLLDVIDTTEEFSVSHFRSLAYRVLNDITARQKLPVLVGGSGLYLRSLTQDLYAMNIPPDTDLRKRWEGHDVSFMQSQLRDKFPQRYHRLNQSDRQNPRRLVRAFEIEQWNQTHHPQKTAKQYDMFWVGLTLPKPVLTDRIRQRVESRLANGVVEEVKSAVNRRDRKPAVPMTGLLPIRGFLDHVLTREEMKELWITEEVQYAKRQMTWFIKNKDIVWFDADDRNLVQKLELAVGRWYTKDHHADKG